jgi:hypothetical protein
MLEAVHGAERGLPVLAASYDLGSTPTTKEAQAIADELYANFVSEEVDKVEMIYTKFVSLISSDPTVQTLLPLTPQARACPRVTPACFNAVPSLPSLVTSSRVSPACACAVLSIGTFAQAHACSWAARGVAGWMRMVSRLSKLQEC